MTGQLKDLEIVAAREQGWQVRVAGTAGFHCKLFQNTCLQ